MHFPFYLIFLKFMIYDTYYLKIITINNKTKQKFREIKKKNITVNDKIIENIYKTLIKIYLCLSILI